MINPITGKWKRTPEEQAVITEAINYKTNSLCWECARACGGGNCPWADDLKAVPGWRILPEEHSSALGVTVVYCPRFIKGRNLSYITDKEVNSTTTNCLDSICRLIVLHDKEQDKRLFQCPKCDEMYEIHISQCLRCKSRFVSDKSSVYATSPAKIQTRKQFFSDYQEDFPNSKYSNQDL